MSKREKAMDKHYDRLREKLQSAVEARLEESGSSPENINWIKPWVTSFLPPRRNDGETFSGTNAAVLWAVALACGYKSAMWVTYKQAKNRGWTVRKGESSVPAFRPISFKVEDENTGEEKWVTKGFSAYPVFNACQCDMLDEDGETVRAVTEKDTGEPLPDSDHEVSHDCDVYEPPFALKGGMKVAQKAAYRPSTDELLMPEVEDFVSVSAYNATLWHELAHATGHADRLNREGVTKPVDKSTDRYAYEEVVADTAALLVAQNFGCMTDELFTNSVEYLTGWVLNGDVKRMVEAMKEGASAARFIVDAYERA